MEYKAEKKFKDPKVKDFSLKSRLKCLDLILCLMENHQFLIRVLEDQLGSD